MSTKFVVIEDIYPKIIHYKEGFNYYAGDDNFYIIHDIHHILEILLQKYGRRFPGDLYFYPVLIYDEKELTRPEDFRKYSYRINRFILGKRQKIDELKIFSDKKLLPTIAKTQLFVYVNPKKHKLSQEEYVKLCKEAIDLDYINPEYLTDDECFEVCKFHRNLTKKLGDRLSPEKYLEILCLKKQEHKKEDFRDLLYFDKIDKLDNKQKLKIFEVACEHNPEETLCFIEYNKFRHIDGFKFVYQSLVLKYAKEIFLKLRNRDIEYLEDNYELIKSASGYTLE